MSTPDTRPIDWSEAKRFFDWIDPSADALWCLQTLDDQKLKELPERIRLTKVFHANRDNLTTVLQHLEWLNARGAGIFLTINRTDGRGRKVENVTAVRALFLDLDVAPVAPVLNSARPPQLVTETSPGKFHCYFKAQDITVQDFRAYQEALSDRFGGDPMVNTPQSVMRVPGFWHRKGEPFLTRIHCVNERPPYQISELEKKVQPVRTRTSNEDKQAHPLMVAAAVAVIGNPDLHWTKWNHIGMTIYAATGGSDDGFEIFDNFSQKSSNKYRIRTTRARWQHYHRSPPTQLGFGTLHRLATQADPQWLARLDQEVEAALMRAGQEHEREHLYQACAVPTLEQQAATVKKVAASQERQQEASATEQTTLIGILAATEQADHAPFVAPPPPPRTTLIVPSTTFIANFQPPDYLVDGWLQRRFIYSFTGLTGTGKTAIALRLTAHVAFGLPLGAREVEQGKVLYLAGENPDDVRMRWIKLCEEMALDAGTNAVFWREGTILLGNSNLWQLLIQDCRAAGPFALVVIDTAAAYYTGQDENDNVQAGSYARLLRQFTKEVAGGPTVLVTTHPPKNAAPENLLPRGGGAFLNEMDGNLTCVKRERMADVHWLGKFRGPDFAPISFLLTPGTSERLKDSKGREVWTVTAKPLGQAEHAAHEATNARNEDRVLQLVVSHSEYSMADMARALGWLYATGEPDKSRVYRALNALNQDGLAKKQGDRWTPTKAGRQKAAGLPPDQATVEAPL